MYAPYPTTHIDVDVNTVKQMPPCHEHIYNQRRYMRSELTAFWRATSEEDMAQDAAIYTDESFTPDLYVMPCLVMPLFGSYETVSFMSTNKTNESVLKGKKYY